MNFKISQKRIRNSCSCYQRTIPICHNTITREKINKSGTLGKWHVKTDCYKTRKTTELNGLEAPDELQVNTVSQHATNTNDQKLKPTCHHYEKPGQYRKQCRLLERHKQQAEGTQTTQGNKNSLPNSSLPNKDNNSNI